MRYLMALLVAVAAAPGQLANAPQSPPTRLDDRTNVRLPNGKLQSEAIIKSEHEKSLQDVQEMKRLILDFSDEFEKSDRNVVSVQAIRKLEEIEKRAKRIRARLTRP